MAENIVSKLLAFDREDIERKKKTYPMALSKLGGEVFQFELIELSAAQACDINDKRMTMNQGTSEMSMHTFEPTVMTLMAGCPSVFRNQDLRKHYSCAGFEDLVDLLLTVDEAKKLAEEIMKISGAEVDADYTLTDDDVKNS